MLFRSGALGRPRGMDWGGRREEGSGWGGQENSMALSMEGPSKQRLLRLISILWASLVAQMVKNLPAMQETQVLSLGWEGPLEKRKATHSSILAWRIPSMGSQRVRHD